MVGTKAEMIGYGNGDDSSNKRGRVVQRLNDKRVKNSVCLS